MKKRHIGAGALAAAGILLFSSLTSFAATDVRSIAQGGAYSSIYCNNGAFLATDVYNKVVWKLSADGTREAFAGKSGVADTSGEPVGICVDGAKDAAMFSYPWDIEAFQKGYIVSDTESHVLRYINASEDNAVVSICGLAGTAGYKDGDYKTARFNRPAGLTKDSSGNIYIADINNGMIRKLNKNGQVTTVAKNLSQPTGVLWEKDVLYVCETGKNRIVTVQNGTVSPFAGAASDEGGKLDGPAAEALFSAPQEIISDGNGTLYVADTDNGCVRVIKDGTVSTYVKSAESKELLPVSPRGLALQEGKLYIGDIFANALLTANGDSTAGDDSSTIPGGGAETADTGFNDVSRSNWYHDAVAYVTRNGIMNGIEEKTFAPSQTLNRAMYVKILSNLWTNSGNQVTGTATFADVNPASWYAESCGWAADNGITVGIGGECFAPLDVVMRQDMAVLLYHYAKLSGADTSVKDADAALAAFSDRSSIAGYATEACAWAAERGILKGIGGALNPRGSATRAEAAQLIMNYLTTAS